MAHTRSERKVLIFVSLTQNVDDFKMVRSFVRFFRCIHFSLNSTTHATAHISGVFSSLSLFISLPFGCAYIIFHFNAFFRANNISNAVEVICSIYSVQCGALLILESLRAYRWIPFRFNICNTNRSKSFCTNEQFAVKLVKHVSFVCMCVVACAVHVCVHLSVRRYDLYGFLIKNPTHGHYNKIFCVTKRKKKPIRTNMISIANAFVFADRSSRTQENGRNSKKKSEGKTKSLFYYFLMLPLIFQHILHIRSSALGCGIYSQIIL